MNFKYVSDVKKHLTEKIIPFWENLRDDEFGGYFGFMDKKTLTVNKKAVKGCILHSRILWFFSNAYTLLKDKTLLDNADHTYEFIKDKCLDPENGGIFWALTYDGKVSEDLKHTYNQAFCIYALSSYYEASGKKEALDKAYELFKLIETVCRDKDGYLEAFTRDFKPADNEKLSENGVMAERTMNTLLHVFEAYTELYRVDKNPQVGDKLREIFDIFKEKMYNPVLHRQEVFFDMDYNTLIDLHSYGHDIETSWLLDRGLKVLNDPAYEEKIAPIVVKLAEKIYETAFDGRSIANECERGKVDETRIRWVQAEAVLGFLNAYERTGDEKFLKASESEWKYIEEYIVDKRPGGEWFADVDKNGNPASDHPIVELWKCPYHNGRMCFEIIRRAQ
ncbi:MAG: AGE family epimerase/isomerase [Lachnospiraceae bacterium]|nr:AGE family epimerase/isomerase [Lachnospiraceae bacterium]